MARTTFLTLAAVLGAGCAGPDPSRSDVTVRDSAGIAVVENARPAWPDDQPWRVEPEPSIVIGAADSAESYMLDRVVRALRLSDGRIVVVNGGTQEVRFFDAHGLHEQSVGGRGGGPGEYLGVRGLFRMPLDSLFVVDVAAARFSVLAADGRFIRSYSTDWRRSTAQGRLTDGRLVMLQYADPALANATGHQRVPLELLLYEPSGAREDTVATLPGSDEFRVQLDGGSIANFDPPFGRRQQVAVHADHIYAGTGDKFEIEVRGAEGRLRRLIRAAVEPRAVAPRDVENWRQAQLDGAPNNPRFKSAVERLVREAPVPQIMPAYSALHVDSGGNIWARMYAPTGEPATRWHVVGADGRWFGEVELPAGFEVHDIGEGYVLGVARDELDIESVRLHLIEKGSVPPSTRSRVAGVRFPAIDADHFPGTFRFRLDLQGRRGGSVAAEHAVTNAFQMRLD